MRTKYYYFLAHRTGSNEIEWIDGLLYNITLSQFLNDYIDIAKKEDAVIISVINNPYKFVEFHGRFTKVADKHFSGAMEIAINEYLMQLSGHNLLPMSVLPVIAALPTEDEVKKAFKEFQGKLRKEEEIFFNLHP